MIFDTNIVIFHIRRGFSLPRETIIPTVVAAELKSFAIQSNWGIPKITLLNTILNTHPLIDVSPSLIDIYSKVDCYSQGKLPGRPLGQSAKNMGKNDIWIASIALALDEELHTSDNDFDHLADFDLKLVKYDAQDPFGDNKG